MENLGKMTVLGTHIFTQADLQVYKLSNNTGVVVEKRKPGNYINYILLFIIPIKKSFPQPMT